MECAAVNLHADHLVHRVGHLAGDETLPDQLVEQKLFLSEKRLDGLRGVRNTGGPDGLVRFLRGLAGFVVPRLRRQVGFAKLLADKGPQRAQRVMGDAHRVGPHVGDQADRIGLSDLQPLIELLGNPHGPRRGVAELVERFLLQRAGGQGRLGVAFLLFLLDRGHRE